MKSALLMITVVKFLVLLALSVRAVVLTRPLFSVKKGFINPIPAVKIAYLVPLVNFALLIQIRHYRTSLIVHMISLLVIFLPLELTQVGL